MPPPNREKPSADRLQAGGDLKQQLRGRTSRFKWNEKEKQVAAAIIESLGSFMSRAGAGKGPGDVRLPRIRDIARKRVPAGPGERKPGGQPGHDGRTIEPANLPIVRREVPPPAEVLASLGKFNRTGKEGLCRRVFELLDRGVVIEYFAVEYQHSRSGKLVKGGQFPPEAPAWVQYGPVVKALAILLRTYLLMPYDRLADFLQQLTGFSISQGTVLYIVRNHGDSVALAAAELAIRAKLRLSGVLHGDETRFSLKGRNASCQVLATDRVTYLAPHRKRGRQALEAVGMLEGFGGTLVHDGMPAYFAFGNYKDSLRLGHVLRVLRGPAALGLKRAGKLAAFLSELGAEAKAKARAEAEGEGEAEARGGALPGRAGGKPLARFSGLLAGARKELESLAPEGPDGSPVQGRLRRYSVLLARLGRDEEAALRDLAGPGAAVPGNLAERALRMPRAAMKVSGCFGNPAHANGFCRMMSYVDTCGKNGVDQIEAVKMLVGGTLPPFFAKWVAEARRKGVWTAETYKGMRPTRKEAEAAAERAKASKAVKAKAKAKRHAKVRAAKAAKAAEAAAPASRAD
jgi:transposase